MTTSRSTHHAGATHPPGLFSGPASGGPGRLCRWARWARRARRGAPGALLAWLLLVASWPAAPAATPFETRCSACHDFAAGQRPQVFNGAGNEAIVRKAFVDHAMGALTPAIEADLPQIVAYLQGQVSPVDAGSTPFNTAKPGIDLGADTTVFLETVSAGFNKFVLGATPPTKGQVSIQGKTATYTPNAGATGTDEFSVQASGPGTLSSERLIRIRIDDPAAPVAPSASVGNVPVNSSGVEISVQVTGGFDNRITVAGSSDGIVMGKTRPQGTVTLLSPPGATTVRFLYKPPTDGFGTDTFRYTATANVVGGASASGTITLVIPPLPPRAGALAMSVPLNTPTTLDLTPYISGSAITGVRISTPPTLGTATVNGRVITYTPRRDRFGSDSFAYTAFGVVGESPAATVSVTIVGRPDPSQDPDVVGLVAAQAGAARRFATAQIENVQRRFDALHRRLRPQPPDGVAAGAGGLAAAPAPGADGAAGTAGRAGALPAWRLAAADSPADGPAADWALAWLNKAIAVGRSGAIDLAASSGPDGDALPGVAGDSGGGAAAVGLWSEGRVQYGQRSAVAGQSRLGFTTSGLTVGADRRVGERLVLGMGLGYARDDTKVGSAGTHSQAEGVAVLGYGSFRPLADSYIDLLIGWGRLDFDSRRFVEAISDTARASRRGEQGLLSLAAGREYLGPRGLLAPYVRLDLAAARLRPTSEDGAGAYALSYLAQTVRSSRLALGARVESALAVDAGTLSPHLRLEYQREMAGEQAAALTYADQPGGPRYLVAPRASGRDALQLALGADFVSHGGLSLGLGVQWQRSSGGETQHALRLRLASELGGRAAPPAAARVEPLGDDGPPPDLQFSASLLHDSNVTRGKDALDRLADQQLRVSVSKDHVLSLSRQTRLVLRYAAGAESWRRFSGLSRLLADLQAELRYRASGEFAEPTYALFVRLGGDRYDSALRDGYRWALGGSVQAALTDRIGATALVSHNARQARNAVFDLTDDALRLNLDYRTGPRSLLYLAGEVRRGDVVAAGRASLDNLDIAQVFVADDAYPALGLFSYRFVANTVLAQVGWNLRLGPQQSLDLAWLRALSTPVATPGFADARVGRYVADQFRFSYLLRF